MKKRYKIPLIISVSCIGVVFWFFLMKATLLRLPFRQDLGPYHELFDGSSAIWVSESPDIWLVIEEPKSNENHTPSYGEMVVGRETIPFRMEADYGLGISFFEKKQYEERNKYVELLVGQAKIKWGRLIIKVDNEKSKYFPGETITFDKQPIIEDKK